MNFQSTLTIYQKLSSLRFKVIGVLIITLCLTVGASAQMLDSLDRVMIDSALVLLNLKPEELGFDKSWVEDDTFKLAIVETLLNNPLELPGYVDETTAAIDSFSRKPRELFEFIGQQLRVDPGKKPGKPPEELSLDFESERPFQLLKAAFQQADPYLKRFYDELGGIEVHDLIMEAPGMWGNEDDSLEAVLMKGAWQREFDVPVDTTREVDSDRLLDIIKKLDIEALMHAGMIVGPAVQTTARGLADTDMGSKTAPYPVEGVSGDVLYYEETEWGRFVIGGSGDNVYKGDFAFVADIGGNDVYRGRFGGAIGELNHPYSIVIDLSGDDYYAGDDLAVNHGAGFLGIGVLVDRDGDDTYRSGNYSQGAGFFGIGIMADHNGADDRRGGYFAQGAGHCGAGILLDDGDDGDDRYFAHTFAQGFASTFGYGLLLESGGDDNYRTGGEYYHAPLLPHDFQSFSGGFGMGWRPRAGGGIGVLYDKGDGNDFYGAEVMSFGSSYWYSLGILVDGGGNDHYTLAHYGLGSGIHLSVGAFYDMDGDDQYRSRMGVVGATPHDLSVGMFVDGSGDDYYIVSDGWGASLTNSFGLFIDRLGNDTYATRGGGYSFGNPKWARGFAGVAIFLDLEGDDVYPAGEPAADSLIWIRSGWGIGIDLARDVVSSEKEEEIGEIELTAEDSAKSIEDLFEEAAQWEVGSARESVRRARKALETKGVDAVYWVVENKLDTRSGLVRRAMNELIKAYPDSSGSILIEKLAIVNEEQDLKNVISLLSEIKWDPAVDPLLDLLKEKSKLAEKVRNSVIYALGKIGNDRAADPISKFVTDKKERTRLSALSAIKELKDTETIDEAIIGLDDPMFTVRSAAIGAVVVFGVDAVPQLLSYIDRDRSKYPELGLRVLKNILLNLPDDPSPAEQKMKFDSIRLFENFLNSDNDQLRAESVDALYRTGGEAMRLTVERRLESEYSPIVLSAFSKVKRETGDGR